MELVSRKRVSKNKSSLITLLCVGASYLACVSCEGTEKEDFSFSSKKQGVDNTDDLTEVAPESSLFSGTIIPLDEYAIPSKSDESSIFLCSESEFFDSKQFQEWVSIANGSKKHSGSSRRVPDEALTPQEVERFKKNLGTLGTLCTPQEQAHSTSILPTDSMKSLK